MPAGFWEVGLQRAHGDAGAWSMHQRGASPLGRGASGRHEGWDPSPLNC